MTSLVRNLITVAALWSFDGTASTHLLNTVFHTHLAGWMSIIVCKYGEEKPCFLIIIIIIILFFNSPQYLTPCAMVKTMRIK